MANIIMILGKSGTGKSTSIKTLNPKETVVFNVLKKRLPFKGSQSIYNAENKNLLNVDEYQPMISFLNACNGQASIKNIIIDDMTYMLRKEFFKRAKEAGYGKIAKFFI